MPGKRHRLARRHDGEKEVGVHELPLVGILHAGGAGAGHARFAAAF
jgi:hypothetical protein